MAKATPTRDSAILKMQLPAKERLLWPIALLGLASVLIVLAVMQYRWSEELTQAASDRMRAGLQSSMMGFREDFSRELQAIPQALQANSAILPSDGNSITERLDTWKASSAHAGLVAGILIAEQSRNDNAIGLRQLNPSTRQFDSVEWPSRLSDLKGFIASETAPPLTRFDAPPHRPLGRPDHEGMAPPWFIDEAIPALVHREVVQASAVSRQPDAPAKIRWIIVELNEDVLRQEVLPELAQHYFGAVDGLIYEVAVTSRTRQERLLYTSSPQFGSGINIPTDARLKLFGPPLGRPGPPRDVVFRERPLRDERPRLERMFGRGPLRLEPISRNNWPEGDWELIVKHRKGSLEAALASTRHRHLFISFAVLLVLAGTMAMIIVVSRRAHRLASLQMQFVAGVSHELRTPLAVIASAADNIADGIVEDKNKITRYGKVIRDQSRQLTQLVEQILLFAATGQNRYQYNLRMIPAAELVDAALANSADLIRTARFTVERHVECTSEVMVDVPAVTHCLQNLIANAIKYGGEARWIGIRVEESEVSSNAREVQISVQDRGIGIDAREQHRIFDAFYRSPTVVSAQIHGTGLGLALAKRIAAAMGGRLTVSSQPGDGSTFTLHLPCAEQAVAQSPDAIGATASSPSGNV